MTAAQIAASSTDDSSAVSTMNTKSGPIRIDNLCVLVAYATDSPRFGMPQLLSREPFTHLGDIFAQLLLHHTRKMVARGLSRDYRPTSEEIPGARGRIDLAGSIRARSMLRGRLVCEFDEYTVDIERHRIIVLALNLLLRRGRVKDTYRKQIRRILEYFAHVSCPSVREARQYTFASCRLAPAEASAIAISQLIIDEFLPRDEDGTHPLDWDLTEERLNVIFEKFVLKYFRIHHETLEVNAPHVDWHSKDGQKISTVNTMLPRMKTDAVLRSNESHRTLIIDTKFYKRSTQSHQGGNSKVISGHLYQIQSYVQHHAASTERPSGHEVMGMLLYAQTESEQQPVLDVEILGHRIMARAVDLNQHYTKIFQQLDEIAALLDGPTP
ncbi:hypothetical protein C1Y63_11755 [Corynebacterium sp. 13CS0277]|uniref:5-methylcytosine restriction system specificity protein McrC n=1 Tax=Corynebacterium sp. 13CS0277 TaxID=2071994 RepID=UPI000D028871|nr:hypothetical protein [Corynebacterium sp. 13CS0277]PRQ10398.1 hypothetical protein C1Y63_11755 [Corynebacterium sp. 13CS0277]